MPTTRRRRSHQYVEIDPDMLRMHLEFDDCLLAGPGLGCGCGLRGPDGVLREELIREIRARDGLLRAKD